MDDPEETGARRRLSVAGLRAAERPLEPEMVAHVVDALFDKCALPPDSYNLVSGLFHDVGKAMKALRSQASRSGSVQKRPAQPS